MTWRSYHREDCRIIGTAMDGRRTFSDHWQVKPVLRLKPVSYLYFASTGDSSVWSSQGWWSLESLLVLGNMDTNPVFFVNPKRSSCYSTWLLATLPAIHRVCSVHLWRLRYAVILLIVFRNYATLRRPQVLYRLEYKYPLPPWFKTVTVNLLSWL